MFRLFSFFKYWHRNKDILAETEDYEYTKMSNVQGDRNNYFFSLHFKDVRKEKSS